MMRNKKILGITGGSGTGKTTVSHILRDLGIYVIDADLVARIVVEKGTPCLKALEAAFGTGILLEDGTLNRKTLGGIVFSDPEKLALLNKITHRYITRYIEEQIDACPDQWVGIDGAVLIESGIAKQCDFLISVLSERELRKKRIMKRDGLTEAQAEQRIDAQKNDSFYIENSDCLIYNNSNEDALRRQVKEVLFNQQKAET